MTSVSEGQRPFVGTEAYEKEGDESIPNIFGQQLVDESQDLANIRISLGEGAEVGPSRGHKQRGSDAVASHIPDDDSEGTVQHGDEVEKIPRRGVERMRRRANVKAVQSRYSGKKLLLNFARYTCVPFVFFH